jgi:hypothetical protein
LNVKLRIRSDKKGAKAQRQIKKLKPKKLLQKKGGKGKEKGEKIDAETRRKINDSKTTERRYI